MFIHWKSKSIWCPH